MTGDEPPVWNEALEWQFDDATLKKLKRDGGTTKLRCYLVENWNANNPVFPRDIMIPTNGLKNVKPCGYVMIDLRNAEGNAKHMHSIANIRASCERLRSCPFSSVQPQVHVGSWLGLQPAWSTESSVVESPARSVSGTQIVHPQKQPPPSQQEPNLPPLSTPIRFEMKECSIFASLSHARILLRLHHRRNNEDDEDQMDDDRLSTPSTAATTLATFRLPLEKPENALVVELFGKRAAFSPYDNLDWLLQTSNAPRKQSSWTSIAFCTMTLEDFASQFQQSSSSPREMRIQLTDPHDKTIGQCLIQENLDDFGDDGEPLVLEHDDTQPIIPESRSTNVTHDESIANLSPIRRSRYGNDTIFSEPDHNPTVSPSPARPPKSIRFTRSDDELPSDDEHKDDRHISREQLSRRSSHHSMPQPHEQEPEQRIDTTEVNPPQMAFMQDSDEISLPSVRTNNIKKHRYRIGVELRNISQVQNCVKQVGRTFQLRYFHHPFGMKAPFVTKPAVNIGSGSEGNVLNGFCCYDVEMSPNQIMTSFKDSAMVVQLIRKDRFMKDFEIGVCWIELWRIFLSEPEKKQSNLRTLDRSYVVRDVRNAAFEEIQPIAKIRVRLSLEDMGCVSVTETSPTQIESAKAPAAISPLQEKERESKRMEMNHLEESRKVIQELEEWKTKQQLVWQEKMEQLETKRLRELEQQFKSRDKERSDTLSRKKNELTKLEKKVRQQVFDLESRQQQLKLEAARVEEKKKELETTHKSRQEELQHSLKRIRSEHKFETGALNRTIEFLKKENEFIKAKFEKEEMRCEELREDMIRYKRATDNSSMGTLRVEISRLQTQIEQLQREKDESLHRELESKQQLKRTLQEVARLQSEITRRDRDQFERQKKEVEKTRLELLTREQFKELRHDRSELQEIKENLNRIMRRNLPQPAEEC